jgi:hypothetical protein
MSLRAEKRLEGACRSVTALGVFSVMCSFFAAAAVMSPWGDMPPPPNPELARLFWVYVLTGVGHVCVASQLTRRRWRAVGLGFAVLSWLPFGTVAPCLWPFSLVAGIQLWRALRNEGVTLLFATPTGSPNVALGFWSAILAGSVYVGAQVTTPGRYREGVVLGALKSVTVAQVLFREGDKEADQNFDYGTLAELSDAGLIDGVLGSGTKYGYQFHVKVDPEQPEFRWSAQASPIQPRAGQWHYAVTQDGDVRGSPEALQLGPDGTIQGGESLR